MSVHMSFRAEPATDGKEANPMNFIQAIFSTEDRKNSHPFFPSCPTNIKFEVNVRGNLSWGTNITLKRYANNLPWHSQSSTELHQARLL